MASEKEIWNGSRLIRRQEGCILLLFGLAAILIGMLIIVLDVIFFVALINSGDQIAFKIFLVIIGLVFIIGFVLTVSGILIFARGLNKIKSYNYYKNLSSPGS